MAFCRNCGTEVAENAFVCVKCGVLINDSKVKNKSLQAVDSGIQNHFFFWSLLIAGSVFVLSGLFFGMSLRAVHIDSYYNSFISWDQELLNASFFTSFGVFLFTLLSYLFSFDAKKKGLCSKALNIIILFLLISSILYLLCNIYYVTY